LKFYPCPNAHQKAFYRISERCLSTAEQNQARRRRKSRRFFEGVSAGLSGPALGETIALADELSEKRRALREVEEALAQSARDDAAVAKEAA
jgi:hypothetical protein